jgi:hypothetical protein
MSMSTTTPPAKEESYFDLHISGIGYPNRIREVKLKKGKPFLACDIAALNGSSDDVSYVRFDCIVSGKDAQHLIRRCKPAVDAEKKVLIGFKLGDLRAEIFTYKSGDRKGEQGVSLKARLLFVSWIKIDGKIVYKAEPKGDGNERREDTPRADETPTEPADLGDEAPAKAPAPDEDESF